MVVPTRTIDLQSNVKVLTVPTPIDIAFVAPDTVPTSPGWYSVIAEQVGRYLLIHGTTATDNGSYDVWTRYNSATRRLCRYQVIISTPVSVLYGDGNYGSGYYGG